MLVTHFKIQNQATSSVKSPKNYFRSISGQEIHISEPNHFFSSKFKFSSPGGTILTHVIKHKSSENGCRATN
jgi:hypothetical protein